MALSTTSIAHASMVAKIKLAMNQAAFGNGQAFIHNRHGVKVMECRHAPGDGFVFLARWHEDVTKLVIDGVRLFHSKLSTD